MSTNVIDQALAQLKVGPLQLRMAKQYAASPLKDAPHPAAVPGTWEYTSTPGVTLTGYCWYLTIETTQELVALFDFLIPLWGTVCVSRDADGVLLLETLDEIY